jgi:hypothetical protein
MDVMEIVYPVELATAVMAEASVMGTANSRVAAASAVVTAALNANCRVRTLGNRIAFCWVLADNLDGRARRTAEGRRNAPSVHDV